MNIYFDSIGCRLNQSEIEKMATQVADKGFRIVPEASQADIVVINTCAVTSAASSDSRQKIRRAIAQSKARIIVTGCHATLEPGLDGADLSRIEVMPNSMKEQIAPNLISRFSENPVKVGTERPRVILPGIHQRTRAFIKVQEGCDNTCAFCVTRIARGMGKSQPIPEIHGDIHAAILGGAKEIVLTGTNLGSWGRDLETPSNLAALLHEVLNINRDIRIRLSSLEPWDLDAELIGVMTEPNFCRHLHLPIQSGCDAVLRMMKRPISPKEFEKMLETIRRTVPEIAITTDIMVGFPGEFDLHFKSSLDFINKMNFSGGHVFRYSSRPGTPAKGFPDRVDDQTSKVRSRMMREAIQRSADHYHRQFTGKTLSVLWERSRRMDNGRLFLGGLTDNYMRVEAESSDDLYNSFSNVLLESWNGKRFSGKIIA